MRCGTKEGKDVHQFSSAEQFATWLAKHHETSNGIWLRLFRKASQASGRTSVTYAEAVDEALCHGWIDGVKKGFDDESSVQWICPRRPRSVWSKINVGKVERLISEGRMAPAGLRQVEAAKADGRWAKAYAASKEMKAPPDFLSALSKDEKAKAFYESLNRANTYAIAWHLHNAKKPETRARRMEKFLGMMARGEKLHP